MISVIIVTYNRRGYLKECLGSILDQQGRQDLELIVIDNGSTDTTLRTLEGVRDPRLKIFRSEKRLSLCSCKEMGIRMAKGEMIAFTDDDCLADPGWLEEINQTLCAFDATGGPVLPAPGASFPFWWRSSLNWLVGINPAPDQKYPCLGSNVAFRKTVFDRITPSPVTSSLLPYMEDNLRLKKILEAGFSFHLDPKMIIRHRVPPDRVRIGYLFKRSYNEGLAWLIGERRPARLARSLFSLPVDLLRLVLTADINRLFRIVSNASYIYNYSLR